MQNQPKSRDLEKAKLLRVCLSRSSENQSEAKATMNLMENSLKEAYEDVEKKPLPYASPVLQEDDEEVLIELDKDFTFAVTYDTMPEVNLGEYKGVKIESPVCKIGKEKTSTVNLKPFRSRTQQ